MGKVSQRGAKACPLPREVWLIQSSFFKNYLFNFGCTESFLLHGLSLVAASESYSPVAVQGLLTEVASFAKQGLQGARASVVVAQSLSSCSSWVVGHGLSCPMTYGIFLDRGSNRCPQHWQADS